MMVIKAKYIGSATTGLTPATVYLVLDAGVPVILGDGGVLVQSPGPIYDPSLWELTSVTEGSQTVEFP
jgi:hypothetical protein